MIQRLSRIFKNRLNLSISQKAGVALLVAFITGVGLMPSAIESAVGATKPAAVTLNNFKHIVVIYEENHSFDNLYGNWGTVNGQKVNGLSNASATSLNQVNQDGKPFTCLLQNDVNLVTSVAGGANCTDSTTATTFTSLFPNAPFKITNYIAPTATTCAAPGSFAAHGLVTGAGLPNGCTEDLVHRFYQEQYQIDGGKMDRYVTGSDAVGLTMGYYDTTQLPIYQYLNGTSAPKYVVADNFFQAAFGGSFLNHQWLIAAQSPKWEGGALADYSANDLHSIVGPDGSPKTYPLHTAPAYAKDGALTTYCTVPSAAVTAGVPATIPTGTACGDYAINTIQPTYQPFSPGTPVAKQLPPLTSSNIGDSLSAKGVDWAWYSGGWDNANGNTTGLGWTNGSTAGTCTDKQTNSAAVYPNCPNANFQYHHQPFNYYANYAPGTAARAAHLLDEQNFIASAKAGTLKPVSFVKPVGNENEHPGYTGENSGSMHLVDLIKAVESGPNAKDTLIVVTYDEFGGAWDHVTPPTGAGVSDIWGPGTRIPALVISAGLPASGVDHTSYDTTSILATIEARFKVAPLTSRDAAVKNLSAALTVVKKSS
ncbi:MAG: acid phosphatase [Actinomycetes bacterium]